MITKFLKNNSIMLIYAVTLLSMFMFVKTVNPIVNYIRYAYVFFMGIFVVAKHKELLFNKFMLLILGCFIAHTVIFGFMLAPDSLSDIIEDNTIDLILFWGFVIFTAQYVWKNRLDKQFLIFSQIATTLFVNYCYITNFNGIAPVKFLPTLFGAGINRIRFTFGLSATNRAAYIALAAFILSLMVWRECFNNKKLFSKEWTFFEVYVFFSGVVSVLVMVSTQTRGALLSAAIFFVLTSILDKECLFKLNFKNIDWKIYFIFAAVLLLFYAYFVFFNADSRSENLAINLDLFLASANQATGFGYTPFSTFLTQGFGLATRPIDCYYLYILCATGFTGLALILISMIIMLTRAIRIYCFEDTSTLKNSYIVLYIVMIFIAFSESSFVAPYSPYSYIYWVMFLLLFLGQYNDSGNITEKG